MATFLQTSATPVQRLCVVLQLRYIPKRQHQTDMALREGCSHVFLILANPFNDQTQRTFNELPANAIFDSTVMFLLLFFLFIIKAVSSNFLQAMNLPQVYGKSRTVQELCNK